MFTAILRASSLLSKAADLRPGSSSKRRILILLHTQFFIAFEYGGKIIACYLRTTVGRAAIPLNSLSFVLRYAAAKIVHIGQISLRGSIVLFGGEPIPLRSLGVVS